MAIKILTKKTGLPIEIGSLNFEFDLSDESIKDFKKANDEMVDELKAFKDADKEDEAFIENAKQLLQRTFDAILGEGSFAKIYKETPSVIYLMDYLKQLVDGILEELEALGIDDSQKALGAKYLAKKNKK